MKQLFLKGESPTLSMLNDLTSLNVAYHIETSHMACSANGWSLYRMQH